MLVCAESSICEWIFIWLLGHHLVVNRSLEGGLKRGWAQRPLVKCKSTRIAYTARPPPLPMVEEKLLNGKRHENKFFKLLVIFPSSAGRLLSKLQQA